MRRITSACLLQTMRFDNLNGENPEQELEIYCKKLDFLYQKLGMNLLKQQRHLQKMVFMVVLSRVVQMTLWQLDF